MEFNLFGLSGIGGLIILALDLWALISVVNSRAATGAKVFWSLLVIVLPVLGFIAWVLAGPSAERR